ncbi:30S ribosomal protein S6 [Candidatus Kaiserbacteria bacterium]|nr:30S ribosomal protein S6 [Candidatus Kaiserbacteria bacterium]
MVEEAVKEMETDTDGGVTRIYEIGYTISPVVKEEDVEKTVGSIRSEIEKAGGSFIAEGAPSLTRLAYEMTAGESEKRIEHDRGYFGWIKFEADVSVAGALEAMLKKDESVMRFIVFRTVREDTRAKMKAPQLREVKRTDTIKTTPRRAEESAGPVSEEELEKALQDITKE